MTIARYNAISASISVLGAVIMLLLGSVPSALIWLAASMIWFTVAAFKRRDAQTLSSPGYRFFRRFLRLLMFS